MKRLIRSYRPRATRRLGWAVLVSGLVVILPFPAVSQEPTLDCDACHGELEFLRQHVSTMADARALLASMSTIDTSAHAGMECTECHTGYLGFRHSDVATTRSCASCHEDVESIWAGGSHALDGYASCAACHGVHDVRSPESMNTPAGIQDMREVCASCHVEPRIPPEDPHADSVSCAGCHEPHRSLPAADKDSRINVLRQAETCGACHDEVAAAWGGDSHAQALPGLVSGGGRPDGATGDAPPSCTGCHGAHGMLAPIHERFDQLMVDRCAACHDDYSDTYFGTYHGKATALGSEIVATCDHCHGSHEILPASDPRSTVAPENLVETCGACHEQAREAFVLYDSHPNPMDRERNAPLFYSFVFMNTLLIGVLGLFLIHTALWWVRIILDKRRGIIHGIGGSDD